MIYVSVLLACVESKMAYQKRGRWIADTDTGDLKRYPTKAMAEAAEVTQGGSNAPQESSIKIEAKKSGSIGIQQTEANSRPSEEEPYSSGESGYKDEDNKVRATGSFYSREA